MRIASALKKKKSSHILNLHLNEIQPSFIFTLCHSQRTGNDILRVIRVRWNGGNLTFSSWVACVPSGTPAWTRRPAAWAVLPGPSSASLPASLHSVAVDMWYQIMNPCNPASLAPLDCPPVAFFPGVTTENIPRFITCPLGKQNHSVWNY